MAQSVSDRLNSPERTTRDVIDEVDPAIRVDLDDGCRKRRPLRRHTDRDPQVASRARRLDESRRTHARQRPADDVRRNPELGGQAFLRPDPTGIAADPNDDLEAVERFDDRIDLLNDLFRQVRNHHPLATSNMHATTGKPP